jgi:nitrite reductase (NO-forming)
MKVRHVAIALAMVMALGACGGDDAADGNGDGGTTEVSITMVDLDFEPGRIEVPAGETITVTLTNEGAIEHDFVLDDGTNSGLVQPGDSTTVEIGPFEESQTAWCDVPGHREAGMEVEIVVG